MIMYSGVSLANAHSLSSLNKLCNRGIWIKDGEIHMDGKFKEVSEAYIKECA